MLDHRMGSYVCMYREHNQAPTAHASTYACVPDHTAANLFLLRLCILLLLLHRCCAATSTVLLARALVTTAALELNCQHTLLLLLSTT
jgi:hypothetical protein